FLRRPRGGPRSAVYRAGRPAGEVDLAPARHAQCRDRPHGRDRGSEAGRKNCSRLTRQRLTEPGWPDRDQPRNETQKAGPSGPACIKEPNRSAVEATPPVLSALVESHRVDAETAQVGCVRPT